MERVNLDWASAWPLRPEAATALTDAWAVAHADPDRSHREGRATRELLDAATGAVTGRLAADDVIWTSGGTESIHLAIHGTVRSAIERGDPRRHLVATAVEHSAVLRAVEASDQLLGTTSTIVEVDRSGAVDPERLRAALTDQTLLVNVQHANHEVGTLQDTHAIANACRAVGAMLHVDACQTVGQLGVTLAQLGADLVSASAGKFGGPAGVGMLAVSERARLAPILAGDDRQRGRRAGRLDVPSVAAAAVALEVAATAIDAERPPREGARRHLRSALERELEDVQVHGPLGESHPGIVSFSCLYVHGAALVDELDRAGFAAHSGSSCARDSNVPSHVLEAMEALTHGHVRASFGPTIELSDIDRFVDVLSEVVPRLRATTGRR